VREDAAAFEESAAPPVFWEKLILAAYFRLLGSTQKQAGAAVGRSERTIRVWEADKPLWQRALAAAKDRWLGEVTSLARRQLLKAMVTADGDLSLKLLERLDEALAPPSQRLKHEGAVSLSTSEEWQALRTTILRALSAYPEARARVVAALTPETAAEAPYGRNGTP
jgi:hypothetical protein